MTKEVGKRKKVREQKESLRGEIASIKKKIDSVIHGTKIPDSVINGDAISAKTFKYNAEQADSVYHVKHDPSPALTVDKLTAIRDRLIGCLNGLQ